jgi:hypothetical protein
MWGVLQGSARVGETSCGVAPGKIGGNAQGIFLFDLAPSICQLHGDGGRDP